MVDGPLPAIMVRHARAPPYGLRHRPARSPPTRSPPSSLIVYAAEAASARRSRRLREVKSPQHGSANAPARRLLGGATSPDARAAGAGRTVLTDRERQIARLAADGVPSRDIADQLYLSTRTVDNHLQRVYTKLGVTGRAGAGRRAARSCPTAATRLDLG